MEKTREKGLGLSTEECLALEIVRVMALDNQALSNLAGFYLLIPEVLCAITTRSLFEIISSSMCLCLPHLHNSSFLFILRGFPGGSLGFSENLTAVWILVLSFSLDCFFNLYFYQSQETMAISKPARP